MTVKFPEKDVARFERKVDRSERLSGCHVWLGSKDSSGYGHLLWNGRTASAHRVAFLLAHGRWPVECALHRCDNRLCINPAHLFEGTRAENNSDRDKKGRSARGESVSNKGEKNGSAKLTEQQVRDIRANYALCRVSMKRLGRDFGVSAATVCLIVNGLRWAHGVGASNGR